MVTAQTATKRNMSLSRKVATGSGASRFHVLQPESFPRLGGPAEPRECQTAPLSEELKSGALVLYDSMSDTSCTPSVPSLFPD